jgi:hypothetical protein
MYLHKDCIGFHDAFSRASARKYGPRALALTAQVFINDEG